MKFYYASELEEMDKCELKDIIDELTGQPTNPIYDDDASRKELVEMVEELQVDIANGVDVVVDDPDDDPDEIPEESCAPKTGGIASAVATVATAIDSETAEVSSAVYVQCGANSGNFAMVGKTLRAAMEFLSNVMTIGTLRTPVVNGIEVLDLNYVLQNGDQLEFVKDAGTKGA